MNGKKLEAGSWKLEGKGESPEKYGRFTILQA